MNTLIVFLLATNAILICISGYYLTARIYPTLFSTTDITGKNPLKNLENAIADIDTASQDTTRLSKTAADAFRRRRRHPSCLANELPRGVKYPS